jgi:hypothetical protein
VRQYPGERVTLDAAGNAWNVPALTVYGAWTWFRDFEITHSGPRVFGNARPHGVEVYGPNTKLINLVIHDNGQGIGLWTAAPDSEAYGNVLYNNGWEGTDRGHGHNLYTQNQTGYKYINNNIMLLPFGYSLHVYSTTVPIDNYQIGKNIFLSGQVLVGGQIDAHNITYDGNYHYMAHPTFGFGATNNANLTFTNNFIAAYPALRWWSNAKVNNNTFFPVNQTGQDLALSITLRPGGTTGDYVVDKNTYYQGITRAGWDFSMYDPSVHNYTYTMWSNQTPWDRTSNYITTQPTGTKIVLQPNQYDPDKANLAIYNWNKASSVNVDLSSLGFNVGDVVDIRNAQNYFAESMTVTYDGSPVTIPMTGWTVAVPVGLTSPLFPVTFPDFGAFAIVRRPKIPVNLLVSPGQLTMLPGQTQQFSAAVEGTSNTAVTWSVSPQVGTVDAAGLYTAPASIGTTTTVQVIATSVADPTRKAFAPITLQAVSVALSPASVALTDGQTQQFNLQVAGTSNTAVTWSLSAAAGTISPTGLYTAPAKVSANTNVTVTATSVADPTKKASAVVMLTPNVNVSLSITPTWASVKPGASQSYAITVYGSTNQGVTWSLSPVLGTISAAGVYTAPYLTSKTPVTITATSVVNRTKTVSAIASVEPFVGVRVTPTSAYVGPGQTLQYSALVGGLSSTSVAWTISPAVGTITANGLYLPPSTISGTTTVTVTATSTVDATKFGTATLTVGPVAVSVTPATATLAVGKTGQFTATVKGTTNTAVTWSLSPQIGTISSTGLYTAPPSISAATTITIKATSVADPTKSATAKLTVK